MAPAKEPENWGTIGNLTSKEAAALAEVKKQIINQGLEEHYGDDKTMLRFCRARKFKVDKVMKMINENDLFLTQFRHHDFRLSDFGSLLQFSGKYKQNTRDISDSFFHRRRDSKVLRLR